MQMPRDDRVTIKIVRDFDAPDGSLYTKDAEHLVDLTTASALILAGVAVKISSGAERAERRY